MRNCIPNKEIIAALCKEKLFDKKSFLITNFFGKRQSLHYPKNPMPDKG